MPDLTVTKPIDPSLVDALCHEVEKGIPIPVACVVVGLDARAVARRIRKSEEGHALDPELRRRLDQAQAKNEARNVELIARAALNDWRAAAWLLERQSPHRWAKRDE